MKVDLDVEMELFTTRGVDLSFEQGLEVSLGCIICGRTHRTVVFGGTNELGQCTPTGHTYPGKIGPSKVASPPLWQSKYRCVIPLHYEYHEVKDRKYPSRTSPILPTWARMRFTATCPKCGQSSNQSTQSNIVRPHSCHCSCENLLYTDTSPPTFKARDA